jgi:hypothetical protein
MRSPREFNEILSGAGKEDVLLQQLEEHCSNLIQRSCEFQAEIRRLEEERRRKVTEEAQQRTSHVHEMRKNEIEKGRKNDELALDDAYRKRMESEQSMTHYQKLLRPSAESVARDHEEAVNRRHERLRDLAKQAQRSQQNTIAAVEEQKQRMENLQEKMLAAELCRIQEKEEREIREHARRQYEEISLVRRREEEIAKERTRIRIAAELEMADWAKRRDAALERESQAFETLTTAQRAREKLLIDESVAKEKNHYEAMKSLQLELEKHTLSLQHDIQKYNHTSEYLEYLMRAAHCTAESKKVKFHGLGLLRDSTLKPSVLTPPTLPEFSGAARRTIGTLTTVSEPIKPTKTK